MMAGGCIRHESAVTMSKEYKNVKLSRSKFKSHNGTESNRDL